MRDINPKVPKTRSVSVIMRSGGKCFDRDHVEYDNRDNIDISDRLVYVSEQPTGRRSHTHY